MKIPTSVKVLIAIVVCEVAGNIGTIFTIPSISTWYATLTKPTFSPPNWVFGPVWTILFALMGIAAFLVWQKGLKQKKVKTALVIFVGQFTLNIGWSLIFFGLHSPGYAFVEIIFLWLAILATIIAFYKISKASAYLLLPYLAWVTFAACLNYAIYALN